MALPMDPQRFDAITERMLNHLLLTVDDVDDVEAELSQGVLTLQFEQGSPYVINSHRSAGQIWMAAERTAWHFSPSDDEATCWRSDKPPHEELWSTLERILSQKLGRPVVLSPAP